MNRMHLTATPPNEGARRLAWWICQTFSGDVLAAGAVFGLSVATVEGILAGTYIPCSELALPIGLATDNFISRRDWRQPPVAGWFDRPSARPSIAELAKAA